MHRLPVNCPPEEPMMRKAFPCHDVITKTLAHFCVENVNAKQIVRPKGLYWDNVVFYFQDIFRYLWPNNFWVLQFTWLENGRSQRKVLTIPFSKSTWSKYANEITSDWKRISAYFSRMQYGPAYTLSGILCGRESNYPTISRDLIGHLEWCRLNSQNKFRLLDKQSNVGIRRQDMKVISVLLKFCEDNVTVTGGFPSQRAINISIFPINFLNTQFETPNSLLNTGVPGTLHAKKLHRQHWLFCSRDAHTHWIQQKNDVASNY